MKIYNECDDVDVVTMVITLPTVFQPTNRLKINLYRLFLICVKTARKEDNVLCYCSNISCYKC